jgi:hypothetical protein
LIDNILKNLKLDLEIFEDGDNKPPESLTAQIKASQINEDYKSCAHSELFVNEVMSLNTFVSNRIGSRCDLFLTDDVFFKSINLMDLVTVNSTRTSCFTKKYTCSISFF